MLTPPPIVAKPIVQQSWEGEGPTRPRNPERTKEN